MRYLLICLFLVLYNCEDKQSKKTDVIKTEENVTNIKSTPTAIDSANANEPEFPILTDKNAMDFFYPNTFLNLV